MLRRIGYISGAAVVAIAVAAIGYGAYGAFSSTFGTGPLLQGEPRTSTVYQLDRDAWTRFPLPRPRPRVRLLVHADVPPEAARPDRSAPLRFAVEVQGVDQAGETVFERLHHFQAGVTLYRAAEGGTRPGKAYADSDAVPTDSQLAVLSLPEPGRIERLRIRAAVMGDEVANVNARLYTPERLSGAQVTARWPRLSAGQRARLAEGNVYPPGLLTRSERVLLSAVRWQRVGPAGVAGRDYVERTLYIWDDSEAELIVPPATPQGVRVGPHRRATVRLPEADMAAQIRFTALEAAAGEVAAGEARVLAFADRPGEVRRVAAPWEAQTVRIEGIWGGRLLELQSDVPAVARLFPKGDEGTVPALDPALVRVFSAAAEPRWRVRHVDGAPTPVRIDLRCACFAPDGARLAPGHAEVALLDDEGAVIERIDIQITEPASPYDRLRGAEADRPVSEPHRLHFRLPPEVAAVRVSGAPNVHAAVFNRPNGLQRTIRVPEDRFAQPATALRDRRSWFYLPPAEGAQAPEATALVAIQARPPEVDPAIAAGDYDWQAYRPEGAWSARRILTPRPDDEAVRPEALGATYTPLPTGEARRLRIDAASPRPVRPSLVFVGHDAERQAPVRVMVDGERVLSRSLGASSGRLRLPAVTPGQHRIRIESESSARFYLSNVTGAARQFGLRLVNRLQPGTTRFVYEKTTEGAELLSFRLYPVLPSPSRRIVEVSVDGARGVGLTPHASLTLPRRRYEVRIDDAGAAYPVLGAAETVGEARRFLVELGADLPPGRYPVEVRLSGEREAYLSLSRTMPGRSEARDVRRRGADDDAR